MRTRFPSLSVRFLGCAALTITIAGCQRQGSDNADTPAATAAPTAGGACRLLKSGEVEAVFAEADRGEVDNSRQQYGISACTWSTKRGTLVAQYWTAAGSSAKDEASGLMLGAVDPLKGAAARNNVRYEAVPGVGEQAVAVIETQDEQRGVLNDFAMLVARRGDQILVLIAPELARSDRTKALSDLQALGKSAVARL